jgi:hypothetical protein
MDSTDIQELARLIDVALASDNPSVKKALRNFMLIVSIVDSENTESTMQGPFRELFNKIDQLGRRIEKLENSNYSTYKGTQVNPYNSPLWINGSGGIGRSSATNTVSPNTTSSSYSSELSTISLYDLEIEMTSILKDVNAT